MNKIKIIICVFLFMFCINVKAETCSTDEMNRLKELANNVEIIKNIDINDVYYNEETNNLNDIIVYYTVKITNLNDDLNIRYNSSGNIIESINKDNIDDLLFKSGRNVTFYVYSYTENSCTDKLLRTITVKFDNYNLYYYVNKDKCNSYSDFKYCKEYMNIGNKSYEEIDKLFDEYIKEKTPTINNNEYLYYIIGGIVLLGLIIIIVNYAVRRHKKNRL